MHGLLAVQITGVWSSDIVCINPAFVPMHAACLHWVS